MVTAPHNTLRRSFKQYYPCSHILTHLSSEFHQYTYVSIHLSNHPSAHPLIQPSILQPSHSSTHISFCLLTEPANQNITPSSHLSIHVISPRSTHSRIYQTPPCHNPFIHNPISNTATCQGPHHHHRPFTHSLIQPFIDLVLHSLKTFSSIGKSEYLSKV